MQKFMELGIPRSFNQYVSLKDPRFQFSSFDSQIEMLAEAWNGNGDFSQRILGYMGVAPFIGNLNVRDFSANPEFVIYSPAEIITNPILREFIGEKALSSLAGMLNGRYDKGLRIATQFKKGHPEPEFIVPGLGTTERNLVLHLDRCGSAEAYSFLFENRK